MLLIALLPLLGKDDKVSTWNGYERRDFAVDGRACLLVLPKEPAAIRPWIGRAEFFGHEPQADLALLARGCHVAYIDVQNLYGARKALDAMDRFCAHLTGVRGLSKEAVLQSFSRGGVFTLNWAARNPVQVAFSTNDSPVCDFKRWPAGKGKGKGSKGDWERLLKVYNLSEEEALVYKLNPVGALEPLAKAKIAMLHVCGDPDDVLPLDEYTDLLESRFKALGGDITVILKPGVGHPSHSLKGPAPLVKFVLKHAI